MSVVSPLAGLSLSRLPSFLPQTRPAKLQDQAVAAPSSPATWFSRLSDPSHDLGETLKELNAILPLDEQTRAKLEDSFRALDALKLIQEETDRVSEAIQKAQAEAKEHRLKQIKALLESLRLLISAADPQTAKRLAMRAAGLAREAAQLAQSLKQLGSASTVPIPQIPAVSAKTAPTTAEVQPVKIPLPSNEEGSVISASPTTTNGNEKNTALQRLLQEIKRELALIAAIARLKLAQDKDEKSRKELDTEINSADAALDKVSNGLMLGTLTTSLD